MSLPSAARPPVRRRSLSSKRVTTIQGFQAAPQLQVEILAFFRLQNNPLGGYFGKFPNIIPPLGVCGHQVTGIDLTESMILEARRTADALGIPAQFFVMDAETPDFPPESFDVLVTRNLTWGLPHLETAYRNWHALLKKDGILINFDADYCRESSTQPLPENHAHKSIPENRAKEYEAFKAALRPGQLPKPQWDMELLEKAGFGSIQTDTQVYRRIYREVDEFYNPTPIFTITARA